MTDCEIQMKYENSIKQEKQCGYIGRTYETKITVNKTLGSQVVVICGFCGSDQDE